MPFCLYLFRLAVFLAAFGMDTQAQQLSVSTYLRDGFTPVAITTDAGGNLYLAGDLIVDPATSRSSILVVKLNPQGSAFLYQATLGGSGSDHAGGIAVDTLGNAFVVGTTVSTDFPASVAPFTPSQGAADPRPFLVKIDSHGFVLASNVIGATVATGSSVAITAQGDVLLSGTAQASGFPATTGAFSMPDSKGRPYLMKFDSTASRLLFSATGIGGAIALDAAGNIYLAGNTLNRDYPITPGAYQALLPMRFICFGLCQISFPGTNQYVTKVDPAASRLIYSTGINSMDVNGQSVNTGLAVDAAGNAYVTGTASSGYPFTTQPPAGALAPPFLTKLDTEGKSLVYSVPQGGGSLALPSSGDLFVSAVLAQSPPPFVALPAPPLLIPAGLATPPPQCLPNLATSISQAVVQRVDRASGTVSTAQLLDGTNLSAPQIAIGAGGMIWAAGTTSHPDVAVTPGALSPSNLGPGPLPGAYLAAFDLRQLPIAVGPAVGCVTDAATGMRIGAAAPRQLVTIFGSRLASATVTFDGAPAQLLYASDSQINVAVPLETARQSITVLLVTMNGASAPARQFPVVISNPSLFASVAGPAPTCTVGSSTISAPVPAVARNPDGEFNSCAQPTHAGSVVSLYVNGAGVVQRPDPGQPILIPVAGSLHPDAVAGAGSAEVVRAAPENDFVWRVDVRLPASIAPAHEDTASLTMRLGDLIVGPRSVASRTGPALPVSIWVSP